MFRKLVKSQKKWLFERKKFNFWQFLDGKGSFQAFSFPVCFATTIEIDSFFELIFAKLSARLSLSRSVPIKPPPYSLEDILFRL